MVSYYLSIHFMALNAIHKNMIGGSHYFLSFLVGACEKMKKLIFIVSLPKSK